VSPQFIQNVIRDWTWNMLLYLCSYMELRYLAHAFTSYIWWSMRESNSRPKGFQLVDLRLV